MMHDFWNWLVSKELAIAGAAGAAAIALSEWPGWVVFFRHVVIGFLCATYIPDFGLALAKPIFALLQVVVEVPAERQITGGAFVTGIAGAFIIQFFIEYFRAAKRLAAKGGKSE